MLQRSAELTPRRDQPPRRGFFSETQTPLLNARTLALATLCVLCTYVVGILAVRGNVLPAEKLMADVVESKLRRAESTTGTRIVIVSGSGAMFGLRSSKIEEATGIPVVNMALNGALGPRYITYLGERAARPRDIILVSFEYPLFVGDTIVNRTAARFSWGRGDDFIRYLGFLDKIAYLRQLGLEYVVDTLLHSRRPADGNRWTGSTVTIEGDLIPPPIGPEVMAARRRSTAHDAGVFWDAGPAPIDRASRNTLALEAFLKTMQARGHRIIAFRPPSLVDPPFDRFLGPARIQLAQFYKDNGVEFIEDDGDRVPIALIYDTAHHLNPAGAEWRTDRLIDALCARTNLCARRRAGSG